MTKQNNQNQVCAPLPDFAEPLLAFYDRHRRPLPWRLEPTPYRVWVSEIMLQQTRVEAVKPYFARFMKELPDLAALAACPQERLNKLWEGLGYYSRVRNLQKAAQILVAENNGQIPSSVEELLRLPGIGSYTAGAIASFAFGIPAPAVDGNVLRVLARVLGDTRNICSPAVKHDYEMAVRASISHARPGDYNQALIEVGATICGPNLAPACASCPLAPYCTAFREGTTSTIPLRDKKKARKVEEKTILLLRDGTHTLLHRRPSTGLLADLYEFPSLQGYPEKEAVLSYVRSFGLEPVRITDAPIAKHIFSHIEWHMHGKIVFLADAALPSATPLTRNVTSSSLTPAPDGDYVFADISDLTNRYAIPSAFASYLSLLSVEKGSRRIKRASL